MARVIAETLFKRELKKAVAYAFREFGLKTSCRWEAETDYIMSRLRKYPESYSPVRELLDLTPLFRGAILMRNFKIIYHYSPNNDTVYVNDLWDMRRDPAQLRPRARRYPRRSPYINKV